MPFSVRPHRRFPVQCAVTYNAGPFLKLLLAYFSACAVLTTLLVLNSGPAYAEWMLCCTDDRGGTIYVDPDTIRRKGELGKMWILTDLTTMRTIADTVNLSLKSQEEYDCPEERKRTLAFAFFSGHMGSGKVNSYITDESKWEPVVPGSIGQELLKVACGKK